MTRGNRRALVPRAVPPTEMQLSRRFNALEKRLTGSKTVPAMNPPAFVQLPWNSWTFERLDTTTSDFEKVTITVNDIIEQIRGRLQFKAVTDCNIRIKVQSAQIWVTASSLVYPDLEASFFELSGESSSTQQPRSSQRDKGTLNLPARCGYMFPSSDRREILSVDDAALLVMTGTPLTTGSNITLRCQVLWQASAA